MAILYEHLSGDIIAAGMAVLHELKPGLDEKHYERALAIELKLRGHRIAQQRNYPVFYKGYDIGTLIPDLIVDDTVIADPKVVTEFTPTHLAQMLGYLAITGLSLGMLLNFRRTKLEWKRVVRTTVP